MIEQFSTRKGITPVVAIVLLLMMTVAAAGGAFAWMNGIIGQTQEDVTQQARTELTVMDVQCSGTNTVDWTIRNSGEVEVDGNALDIFVYNVSNGALQDVHSGNDMTAFGASDNAFGPGELFRASGQTISGDNGNVNFQGGNSYRIVWEFTNSDVSVEGVCQAQ